MKAAALGALLGLIAGPVLGYAYLYYCDEHNLIHI